jgi:hypothetical protein
VLTAAQALAISNAMEALPNALDLNNPAYPCPTQPETGEFHVVWFSDQHLETWVTASELATNTKWLKNNKTRMNIQAVLCGGDMTDSIETHPTQQASHMTAMVNLATIPHLQAIGNHDYGDDSFRDSAIFNTNFPQSYYTGKSWWSGGFFEAGHTENAYMLLTIGAVDYIFLVLEFFARQAVIDWADALLTTHAARKAIIITHAYEYTDSTPYSVGDGFGPTDDAAITDSDYHWGDEIWTELLNIHDNVILVHSGHITPYARHVANSAGGQPVNQLLQNFQGGSGFENSCMRFMRFNPATETIYVETYSPVTNTRASDGGNKFTLTY